MIWEVIARLFLHQFHKVSKYYQKKFFVTTYLNIDLNAKSFFENLNLKLPAGEPSILVSIKIEF